MRLYAHLHVCVYNRVYLQALYLFICGLNNEAVCPLVENDINNVHSGVDEGIMVGNI